jgi:hypothetical protein
MKYRYFVAAKSVHRSDALDPHAMRVFSIAHAKEFGTNLTVCGLRTED